MQKIGGKGLLLINIWTHKFIHFQLIIAKHSITTKFISYVCIFIIFKGIWKKIYAVQSKAEFFPQKYQYNWIWNQLHLFHAQITGIFFKLLKTGGLTAWTFLPKKHLLEVKSMRRKKYEKTNMLFKALKCDSCLYLHWIRLITSLVTTRTRLIFSCEDCCHWYQCLNITTSDYELISVNVIAH